MAKGTTLKGGADKNVKSTRIMGLDQEGLRLIDAIEANNSASAQTICKLAEKIRVSAFSRLSLDYASAVMAAMEQRPLLEKVRKDFMKKLPTFLGFYDHQSEKTGGYCYDKAKSLVKWNEKEKSFSFSGNKEDWKKAQLRIPQANFVNLKVFFPKKEKEEISYEDLLKLVYGHSKRRELAAQLWRDEGFSKQEKPKPNPKPKPEAKAAADKLITATA